MDEINPLSKFQSPLISFTCSEDTIFVPGIVCGTTWGSFPALGSFAVLGTFARRDHLRARTAVIVLNAHTKFPEKWSPSPFLYSNSGKVGDGTGQRR